jgi:tRNA1Val (adenine37-N6)-methyltransferase
MINQFEFKQFTIHQDLCAMKVGTDGVLLGAWSTEKEGNILDIGSGTGLIAIMLAQRTKSALINAIDINENAYLQTLKNIKKCTWENRINVFQSSLQEFNPNQQYDLIISNPPFFTNSTKAPKEDRNTARHTDHLPYAVLIKSVTQLLKDDGIFSVILPIDIAHLFINEAEGKDLYLNRRCFVKPNPIKAPKRVLMEFSFHTNKIMEEEITIETVKRHHYTKEYIILTQDFYLNF